MSTELPINWPRRVAAFNNQTLPALEWKHSTHLAVAIWHLLQYGSVDAALPHLRSRIIRLNEALGFENSDTKGYHETLTVFWALRLQEFIEQQDTRDFETLVERVLAEPRFFDKSFVLKYYAQDPWTSTVARKTYQPPDRH